MAKKKVSNNKEVDEVMADAGGNSDIDASKKIELVKRALSKKYGNGVISVLDEHKDVDIQTISTGSMSLDTALGNGGMGIGRVYEVYGPPSSGKTTLAASVIVQAQRRGMRALYIDAEHAIDPLLLRKYGVKTDLLEVVQGIDGEQNLDILEKLMLTEEYRVAVVDSVSALVPRDEFEGEIEDNRIGLQAKLMSKALKKLIPIASQTNTLIIFINQMRVKINNYSAQDLTTGGMQLGYAVTGKISVKGGEAKDRRILEPFTGDVIGHKTLFEITKNKLSAPYRKAEIDLYYGVGYDNSAEVLNMAVSLGIIEKSGAWYKFDGENFAQGEARAVTYMKDPANADFVKHVSNEVLMQSGLKEVYEQHKQSGPLYA